jgi:hypothetical protein
MRHAPCFSFLVVLMFLGCQMAKVPESLLGTWEATAPRYAGCNFVIKDGMIIFDNGAGHVDVNHISKIEERPAKDRTLYRIRYEDSNKNECTLSLYYCCRTEGDVILFKNQMQIEWRRCRAGG